MAEFKALQAEDLETFTQALEKETKDEKWFVVSSNAYVAFQTVKYYALLQKSKEIVLNR